MGRRDMLQVVAVHVGVHLDAFEVQLLVVLRTGKRREVEKLQQVDWQLPLDEMDVADDRFGCVGGETENIAGIRDDPGIAPGLQHGPIFADEILAFFGGDEILGVDVFQPDKDLRDACLSRLVDKPRDLMGKRVDLDHETQVAVQLSAELDQAVEFSERPAAAGQSPSAQGLNISRALENVVDAQDEVVDSWVDYESARLSLYRDMGIMQIDPSGVWLNDPSLQAELLRIPPAKVTERLPPPEGLVPLKTFNNLNPP